MSDPGLNPIEVAVLVLIVVATSFGFKTGFVATTYSLASWILAVAAALAFEGPATTIVETIARLPTSLAALSMDSPGHRENVLRPEFTRIGTGVIIAGAYGRMFTQLFVTP